MAGTKRRIAGLIGLFLIGCSAVIAQSFQIPHDGQTRDFILHLPSGYTGSQPVPLVLNFHGYGSSNQAQQFYTAFDYVSDTAHFIVVYPQGLNNSWNVGFEGQYNTGTDDVGFTEALIDTLFRRYNIDPARIYSTGMSNGGFFSYRLACELPGRFAAIASVTGTMTDTMAMFCPYVRDFPVMEVHGTNDGTVPYNGNAFMHPIDTVLDFWITRNGVAGNPVTFTFPDVDPSENSTVESYQWGVQGNDNEVLHLKVINGGHSWPGAIDVPSLGTTNHDIYASGEVWDFFRRHVNPAPVTSIAVKNKKVSFEIFPNPAGDFLFTNQPVGALKIFDLTGRFIGHAEKTGPLSHRVPGEIKNGIYLVLNGQSEPVRIILMR